MQGISWQTVLAGQFSKKASFPHSAYRSYCTPAHPSSSLPSRTGAACGNGHHKVGSFLILRSRYRKKHTFSTKPTLQRRTTAGRSAAYISANISAARPGPIGSGTPRPARSQTACGWRPSLKRPTPSHPGRTCPPVKRPTIGSMMWMPRRNCRSIWGHRDG